MDLERGGHVLREEYSRGGDLWYRIHDVKLEQFPLKGGEVIWFPMHGEFDSFVNGDRFLDHPVLHESYDIVRGSLVFNQSLPDARFSIEWSGHKSDALSIKGSRQEFQAKQKNAKAEPSARIDPAGVEEDLDRQLAAADAQSRRLEATQPSRAIWNGTTLAQAGIAIISFGALIMTVILKRRGR
jgi:hypothetical protein